MVCEKDEDCPINMDTDGLDITHDGENIFAKGTTLGGDNGIAVAFMLALLADREYDPPTALATAILAMLLQNPITITSVSFQLSVCCMIGIFTFSGKIHDYLLRGKRKEQIKGKSVKARVLRWVVISISITLSATIITAPLSAYYFGSISLIGVITNILTLPLISVLFYGIMVACLVSVVSLPIAGIIARIISWPIRYVLWISRILAKFPLAAVYTSSVYIVIWLVFAYLIFAFFAISKKKRIKLTLGFVIASLLLAVGASHLEPRLDNYRVTVFDVGQGQCILLQSKNEHYLVDCGGDSGTNTADQVAQLLRSQGVTRLDGIFLTHYDKDHASGVLPLLSQISVKTLYLPDIEDTGIIRNKLTAQYEDKIQWVNQTMKIAGNCFTVSLYPAQEREDNNENCLCLLFQAEKCDILITGDRTITGEKALLEETTLPKLELLVVGHHGSGYSTGMDLLEATEPTSAVISVGEGNTFGHPADQVLTRLKLFNTKLYRTDLHGTIVFRG